MTDERFYLHELAGMVAARILTADDPAAALAKFEDDLAGELAAGRLNLVGSEALRAAFRDAMGYSRRVPDAVGEESAERRDQPGSVRGSASRTSPGSSPTAPGEDSLVAHGQLRVIDGGEA